MASRKNRPVKSNGIPEQLKSDSGTDRIESELVDCLSEVVSGATAPGVYGLTDVNHARDLLAGLDGGIQALARADAAREENDKQTKLAEIERKEQEEFQRECDAAVEQRTEETSNPNETHDDGTGNTPPIEQASSGAAPAQVIGKTGKPLVLDDKGRPKYRYAAAKRARLETLGVAGTLAVSVQTASGHLENFVKTAASWEVENDGHDVTASISKGTNLGELGKVALKACADFALALENVAAIPGYKPSSKRRKDDGAPDSERGNGSALAIGQEVWLRDKVHTEFSAIFNVASHLIVKKIAGSKYVLDVADPKDGEARVTLSRSMLKTQQ